MIQTSKDVLFIILGVSILIVSVFFSLLLYYLIRVVSEFSKAIKIIGKISQRADDLTKTIKEKVSGFSLVPLISEAIRLMIDFLRKKKDEKKSEKEKN